MAEGDKGKKDTPDKNGVEAATSGKESGKDARPPGETSGKDARPPGETSGKDARPPGETSGKDARPPGETSGVAKAEKAEGEKSVEERPAADKSIEGRPADPDKQRRKATAAKKSEPAKAEASHAHPAAHGHHAPNRKEYWKIFVVLFVMTALEVGIAQMPGIGKGALYVGLIGLALSKAACVALFYMHLKHETKVLRYTVALPFAAPALYAFVLIAEAAYRLTRSW